MKDNNKKETALIGLTICMIATLVFAGMLFAALLILGVVPLLTDTETCILVGMAGIGAVGIFTMYKISDLLKLCYKEKVDEDIQNELKEKGEKSQDKEKNNV